MVTSSVGPPSRRPSSSLGTCQPAGGASVRGGCGTALGFLGFTAFGFVAVASVAAFGRLAADCFVAAAVVARRVVVPRRSPPRRVGRVEDRAPRTLASLAVFFVFFLADF